ncbi:PAS domain-containing sensor histidine kinase [Cohaesibacter celericrescens]|uniref:histidine kinase n=1 Tax=Cohaesibacter celericrescens TaxID=2067669 RepID=A0A2N5XN24_9HYPH|nr:PAS domain-containing sensor histidine kinase [Cohaesibacter celericrescens]PLW75885.1 two-component sensor histidine kinase [Cohaesibacter celericrescens]
MPKNGLFGDTKKKYCLTSSKTCLSKAGRSILSLQAVFLSSIFCVISYAASAQNATVDLVGDSTPAIGSEESLLPMIPDIPLDLAPAFTAPLPGELAMSELLILSLFCALIIFSLLTGWAFMREKRRGRGYLLAANTALQTLQARLDQSESLLNASDQLMVIWNGPSSTPEISGSLANEGDQLPQGTGILAFGNWLHIECAQQVEQAIDMLRTTGQRFVLNAETLSGGFVEIKGSVSGSRALMQLRILQGDDQDRARLTYEANRQANELARLKHLLDAVPMPIWSRDDEGRLSWINQAYSQAVEGESIDAVLQSQIELLDQRGRDAMQQAQSLHADDDVTVSRQPVIVAGKRQIFDIVDIDAQSGTVGIATDASEVEAAEKALERMQAFHANTMDQLTTPVAIFDSTQQLQYFNAAYSAQFKLDPSFLESHPQESAILDRLRTNRSLPEQADYQSWKADFMSSYRDVDAKEHWWYLPDGQSLRVISAPNPDGGVTYLFENVTERLDLEKRYNALIRMQSETLDHLNDGVVVFGTDGRMRVSNPAFTRLWDIPSDLLKDQPHVAAVVEWCRRKFGDETVWSKLKGSVVGLEDKREGVVGQMECLDGRFLDYAAIPLPDGATMITFVDVTDNVTVERGLQDRNEALLAADQLKNTFIQHVSYELRSPLTNIIGFTELLTSEAFGSLNDRQREYTDHIMTSSSSLLAIVNDILDLATIDAGIMALELGQVDPVDSIRAAAEGLQDRLTEKDIRLDISVAENMGEFVGDQKRVRQVLFNLISNAIAFSDEKSEISIVADRNDDSISFAVQDHGCGMPASYQTTAFDRFESRKAGPSRRGAGLGLSIVKSFVELHGGTISVESNEGSGTQVTCVFPIEPKTATNASTQAAE